MLDVIISECKEDYEILKDYSFRMKEVTNIYHQIFIEKDDISIRVDLEHYGNYIGGVLFQKKNEDLCCYALADYSHIEGARDIFDYITSVKKEEFYKEARLNLFARIFRRKHYNYRLTNLIYSLAEEFIRKVS